MGVYRYLTTIIITSYESFDKIKSIWYFLKNNEL